MKIALYKILNDRGVAPIERFEQKIGFGLKVETVEGD